MAQHEPNMVPTWPKMSQHSPKWSKISLIWSQLLPNKGRPKPQNTPKMAQQRQTQTTEYTKMAQHEPIIWCRHSPQWPNISPRSGKHSLTAACPKKETKTKKNRSINHQQRSPQIVFFPGILGVFCKRLAWTKIQRHWNAQVQNKGRHRSENSPKWPNMSPIWCQHGPKCPNIAQNGPR